MFYNVKHLCSAVLFIFVSLALGCATSTGPGVARSPDSPPLSETDERQNLSVPGEGPGGSVSSNREEYNLMANVREALDKGSVVETQLAEKLIEQLPDSSYSRFLAGSIYLRQGDIENARRQLTLSNVLDRSNDHALTALGDMAFDAGDFSEADLYYTKAHKAAATPSTANRLALLRIQGGYLESAKEILSKTLSDHPGDIMTRNNLAIAMDMMGTTSEGINILTGDGITDPQLLHTRALLELKEGHPDRAIKDLETGFDDKSSDGEWLLKGIADLQQGRLNQAEDQFRASILASPEGFEGYLNLGLTLRRQGRFTEAEKIYREGLDRAPHPDLHLNLGVLYELYRGEPALALDQYKQYLQQEGPASDRVRGWAEFLEGVLGAN